MDTYQLAWDMFFANLVAIQYHPGNPAKLRMSLEDLADITDEMMKVRANRCRSLPLQ